MAQKVITYYGPGLGGNHLMTTVIDTDTTIDTEWTNITTAGQFTDGTLVQYAERYDTPIIDVISGVDIFRGGTVSASHGASPSDVAQLVGNTTSIDLANGTTNNLSIGDFNVVNITGLTGSATITGIAGGVDGARLSLINNTGQDMTLSYDSGSSDAENRIYTATGANISIVGSGSFELLYIGSLERWFVVSSEAAGSGSGTVTSVSVVTANGVSGSVATATTTPAITLTLGAITPSTVDPTGIVTVINEGLHILDTNASHDLVLKAGSDLTADRILTITTGDAAKTLDLTGGNLTTSAAATVGGTNTGDQLLRSTVNARCGAILQNLTAYVALTMTSGESDQSGDPTDPAQGLEEYAWVAPFNGTIRNLYGRVNTAPAAGQTFTVTIVRNTVDGILTATFTDAGVTASDAVNSVSFSAGDRLAWKVVTSATSGDFSGTIAAEIRAD